MSEFHEDNLNTDYKDKSKRNQKNGSLWWLFGLIGLGLVILMATSLFLATRPTPKTVMEFAVQQYPTFAAPSLSTQAMVATTNGFAVLATAYDALSLNTFLVNLNLNQVLSQVSVPIAYGAGYSSSVASAAINPSLDLLWSNYGNVTMFMSAEGLRQTVALNAIARVAFSGDGSRFALLTSLGEIVVYDTASRAILYEMPKADYAGQSFVAFNQNGTKLIISGMYSNAQFYDLSGSAPQLQTTALPAVNADPIFLSSGEIIGINNNAVIVVNGDSVKTLPLSDPRCSMATQIKVSSDETTLAIMGQSNLCVTDVPTMLSTVSDETLNTRVLDLQFTPSAIAFSSDSQTIGVYTMSYTEPYLYVVDVASMTIVAKMDTAP